MAVQGMNIDILPPEEKIKDLVQLITFKSSVQVEFETPHQMRVGNIHEPQAGVDVTTAPTEGQTQTLRRQSAPITPLRFGYVDDDEINQEEAPDNSTTDDEDDHVDKKTSRDKLRSCAGRERERRCHRRRRTPQPLQRARGRHD